MCDICGKSSCCNSFHSLEEQEKFEPVIELFEKARELRKEIREEIKQQEEQKDCE
jgi:epoxyqueuosine reductase QueG